MPSRRQVAGLAALLLCAGLVSCKDLLMPRTAAEPSAEIGSFTAVLLDRDGQPVADALVGVDNGFYLPGSFTPRSWSGYSDAEGALSTDLPDTGYYDVRIASLRRSDLERRVFHRVSSGSVLRYETFNLRGQVELPAGAPQGDFDPDAVSFEYRLFKGYGGSREFAVEAVADSAGGFQAWLPPRRYRARVDWSSEDRRLQLQFSLPDSVDMSTAGGQELVISSGMLEFDVRFTQGGNPVPRGEITAQLQAPAADTPLWRATNVYPDVGTGAVTAFGPAGVAMLTINPGSMMPFVTQQRFVEVVAAGQELLIDLGTYRLLIRVKSSDGRPAVRVSVRLEGPNGTHFDATDGEGELFLFLMGGSYDLAVGPMGSTIADTTISLTSDLTMDFTEPDLP